MFSHALLTEFYNCTVAFWVQAFYARRIVVLGRSRTWTVIGIVIVVV